MNSRPIVLLGLVCALVLGAAGCGGSARGPAQPSEEQLESERQAVIAAHRALVAAYEAGDVAEFVRWLDPTPELLIFHPRVLDRFDGIDKVRRYLPAMFARLGRPGWSELHPTVTVRGDVAWLATHVVVESAGLGEPFAGRGTEIWVRRGDGWRLTHAHWSANPAL